jgi:hypothetical protein
VYIILFLSLGKSKSGRTYVNGHKGGGGFLFTKYIKKNQGPFAFIMRMGHNEIYDGKKCIHYALVLFATRVFFHALSFLRGTAASIRWVEKRLGENPFSSSWTFKSDSVCEG